MSAADFLLMVCEVAASLGPVTWLVLLFIALVIFGPRKDQP